MAECDTQECSDSFNNKKPSPDREVTLEQSPAHVPHGSASRGWQALRACMLKQTGPQRQPHLQPSPNVSPYPRPSSDPLRLQSAARHRHQQHPHHRRGRPCCTCCRSKSTVSQKARLPPFWPQAVQPAPWAHAQAQRVVAVLAMTEPQGPSWRVHLLPSRHRGGQSGPSS